MLLLALVVSAAFALRRRGKGNVDRGNHHCRLTLNPIVRGLM
jgi:hypothetical protein